jgi:hypothetical protein
VDSWQLKMEQIGCPETSIRDYQYSLRNNPKGRSLQKYCVLANFRMGWSLRSYVTGRRWLVVTDISGQIYQWTLRNIPEDLTAQEEEQN